MAFRSHLGRFCLTILGLCLAFALKLQASPSQSVNLSLTCKAVLKNSFFTGRGLGEYIQGLHSDFELSLNKLEPHQVWIDLGGGEGRAVEDYLKSKNLNLKSGKVVLITYKLGRWFGISNYQNRLQVFQSRLLEDIPVQEIPKAQLMTDFFGVLSYTLDLEKSLNIILNRLNLNGEIYIYSSHRHTLIESQKERLSLTEFLKRISGIQVEGQRGILKITKVSQQVSIPKLELIQLEEASKPPFRRFKIKN